MLVEKKYLKTEYVGSSKENKEWNYKIMLVISAMIGAVIFLLIYGIKIIDVTYDDWLANGSGDMAAHYLGWLYYRDTPWQFPIGLLDGMTYPYKFSVLYMDSIPIVALICKIFSPILPSTFQYFGLYGLFTFMLQAIISCALVYKFTRNSRASVIGSVFFIISSTMLQRMFHHSALAFHPIILLSILCYFSKEKIIAKKRDILYWTLLLVLSCSVHAYFIPIVFAFIAAFYLSEIISKKWYIGFIKLIFPTVITVLVMYIWGYFYGSNDLSEGGLGSYNSNLNVLFNNLGTSYIASLMGETATTGIWETYAYLGAGIFILGVIVLYDIVLNKRYTKLKKKYVPTLILIVVFLIVSTIPTVRIGKYTVFEFTFPNLIIRLLSIFRVNGRFMWPVIYLIMLSVIVYVIQNYRNKGILLLLICLFIQILDLSKLCVIHHDRVKALTELSYKLKSSVWDELDKSEIFFFYNPIGGGAKDITCSLGKYAYDNNMVMNDFYASRRDSTRINQGKAIERSEILDGNPDDSKLYVFSDIPMEFLTYETGLKFYEIDGILIGVTNQLKNQKEISIENGIDLIDYSSLTVTEGKEDKNGAHIYKDGVFYVSCSLLPSGIYHIEYDGDNLDNTIFSVSANGVEFIDIDNMQESDERVTFDITLDLTSNIIFNCENTGEGEILLTDTILSGSKSNRKLNEYHMGESISFIKSNYNASPFIKQGMSHPEESFTWTEGNETSFSFRLDDASAVVHGSIEIAGVFNGKQEVTIFVNEMKVYSGILSEPQNIEFDFVKPDDNIVEMRLELPDAISPFEVNNSSDKRQLALRMRSIIFTNTSSSD